MTQIFNLDQIKEALKKVDPLKPIEEGFVAYSQGKVVVPPVGELTFKDPPGEVHIKYGFIIRDDFYVIKIASGFPKNREFKLPSGNGLMLIFSQKTGDLECILLDEAYLTDVRTAAAGAVIAKYMAPNYIKRIGIVGPGVQGRMQLEYLRSIIFCKDVLVWGRNQEKLNAYKREMEPFGFDIQTTLDAAEIAQTCNFIVTCTPSLSPLLWVDQIQKGTHITAMGSDTPEKNELDPKILQKADIVVADSISQCLLRGEIHHAIKKGLIQKEDCLELGKVIANQSLQRTADDQITVADSTGVAIQDIQISKAIYKILSPKNI